MGSNVCAPGSDHWLTVSGTYVATATRTTIAPHGEGSLAVYFSQVFMTTAGPVQGFDGDENPDDLNDVPVLSPKGIQQGTGNVRNTAQARTPAPSRPGTLGRHASRGYSQNSGRQLRMESKYLRDGCRTVRVHLASCGVITPVSVSGLAQYMKERSASMSTRRHTIYFHATLCRILRWDRL